MYSHTKLWKSILNADVWVECTFYHLLSTCDFHDSMSAAMLLHMRVVANIMMIIVTSISAHDALVATVESFVC